MGTRGSPGGSVVKNLPASTGFDPRVGKIPWQRKWQPTSVSLPGKSHGQEPRGLQSVGLQRVRHNLGMRACMWDLVL